MLEKLKQIPAKIVELWKKYTKRQKVIIVSVVFVVVLTLAILIILLNQVTYTKLMTFDDTSMAKEAMSLLDAEGIAYRLDEDNITLNVDVSKKQAAVLALTDSSLMSNDKFSLADLLNGDMSQTNTDKMRNMHLFMQSQMNEKLSNLVGVDKGYVLYFPSDKTNSILQAEKEISCSVMLTINDDFDVKKMPTSIANIVAASIGNSTTEKIKVIDQYGNLLFGGEEDEDDFETLNDNLAYKKQVEKWYKDELFQLAIKNGFADAEVSVALDMNMDKVSQIFTEYLPGEGLEQGYFDETTKITSESTGAAGDIPGTDSNDETDYYIQQSGSGNSSYSEEHTKYKLSERVTETLKEQGAVDTAKSSIGITLTRVNQITEESLEADGLLAETTFEEYRTKNEAKVKVETDEELYQLFAKASGIPENNLKILVYEQPSFIPKEIEESADLSLLFEIILALMIVGLLLFVVFRAMKPEEVVETEPELSVERLLATTKENQSLEDIEFGQKSETRKLVEKYIDENPEAVAALLRNWLSDDGWGE